MGFQHIPSLRLENLAVLCSRGLWRGAPAARVRLPVAFVNAEACGEGWRGEDCAGERNVVKYAKGQIIFSALSEIDTVSEYNAA